MLLNIGQMKLPTSLQPKNMKVCLLDSQSYIIVTPKVLDALIDGIPVVTPSFLDYCISHKTELALPAYES